MEEKILVPLDGSKVGESALPYVEDIVSKLSREVKVEVTLFQVPSPMQPRVVQGREIPDIRYTEKEVEQSKQKAIDYLTKAGEALRSKGATVTPRVAIGTPAEEIVKAAVDINANLIAMSTHGRSGLSRLAFGSVADKVLRHGGTIPVMMVKATEK